MKKFLIAVGKAVLYTLLFFVLQLISVLALTVIGVVVGLIVGISGGELPEGELLMSENLVALSSLITAILLLLFCVIFFAVRGKRFSHEVGFHALTHPLATLSHPFVCGFGLCILATFAISVIPFPETWVATYEEYAGQIAAGNPVLMLLATVILAPLTEEIVFRGLIYTRLKRGMPVLLAALLSALIFGIMHGTLLHMVFTVPMGLFLCLFYDRFGSLWVPIALHMGFNLCGSVLSYYPMDSVPMIAVFIAIGVYLTVMGLLSIGWYRNAAAGCIAEADPDIYTENENLS